MSKVTVADLAKAKKRIKPKYRRRPTVRRRKRTGKDFIADINCTLNRIEVLIEHYIELQLEVSKHIVGEQFVENQRAYRASLRKMRHQ